MVKTGTETYLKLTEPAKVRTFRRTAPTGQKMVPEHSYQICRLVLNQNLMLLQVRKDLLKNWSDHFCWSVVDSYFSEHGVVQQQVDSYNGFLSSGLSKIIKELPPIGIKSGEVR